MAREIIENELSITTPNKVEELDEMLVLTKQLSIMSNEMNSEIGIQNEKIDQIDRKVENTDLNLKKLNKRIKKFKTRVYNTTYWGKRLDQRRN